MDSPWVFPLDLWSLVPLVVAQFQAEIWSRIQASHTTIRHDCNWLVVSTYPSEKYDFVSWDDYFQMFPIYGKIQNV